MNHSLSTAIFLGLTALAVPASAQNQEVDTPVAEVPAADAPAAEVPAAEVPAADAPAAKPPEAETTTNKPAVAGESGTEETKKAEVSIDPAAPDKKTEPDKKPEPVEKVADGVWILPPSQGEPAIDFSLVGEYSGLLDPAEKDADAETLALQIRCIGDGQFDARVYQGGLPGEMSFEESSTIRLIGRRSGQTLVLSGGPWALIASDQKCLVISNEGERLGELPRVERTSPTLGAKPPEGATVLFSGSDTDAFSTGTMTSEGLLQQGADINLLLHDFDLHLEFRVPFMPNRSDQARGNSGIYLQSRYECQILDSFGDERVFNGLGALYRFRPADVNMAFPPLVWQTYDIRFTAPRYAADGSKLRPAHVTSWVNGVKIQDDVELKGPTGNGAAEEPLLLPTKLQDHKDPVRFRNIWVVDRGIVGLIDFPVQSGE